MLQIGTHDLLQPPSSSAGVGNDPLMPNRKPLLAIQEVFQIQIMRPGCQVFLYPILLRP